jgi:hypothetical protein
MDELDGYANIAAEFLPTYEIASATDPMFSFLRFLYMANEDHSTDSDESAQIWPWSGIPRGVSVPDAIRSSYAVIRAVLIEAKLATCTAADRYSGDYEKVKAYLEDKLMRTKGVNQLLKCC